MTTARAGKKSHLKCLLHHRICFQGIHR